ncbi:MAG: hypothetical protein DMG07_07535, partial [Acidobacteria bacterium]
MFRSLLRAALAVLVLGSRGFAALTPPTIREIRVEGNQRIPAASILHHLAAAGARSAAPLDAAVVQAGLRALDALQLFDDLEIATEEVSAGEVDLIVRVAERPFVSEFVIEGVDDGLERRIRELLRKEKLEIRPASPFRPEVAKKASVAARGLLQSLKHPNASAEIVPERRGTSVRVVLRVTAGPRLQIGRVLFDGNSALGDGELLDRMRDSRPARPWARLVPGARAGTYVPEDLTADLDELRRYYRERGFAAVDVGRPWVRATSLQGKLEIQIPIVEGPRFELESVRLEGDPRDRRAEVSQRISALGTHVPYDASKLESARRSIVSALGRAGYALAEVKLEETIDSQAGTVRAVYHVDPGDPVWIGAVRFEGNQRVADKFLRRELRLGEGDLFDSARLDSSIERLNRSGLVAGLERKDVKLEVDPENHDLGLTFRVKEPPRQGIFATGSTGGAAGGYLGIIYSAFNLLGLGESLGLEIDGGAAQSNLLLDLAARHFLGSPFLVGLSLFHRATNLNVASIVPGERDLVSVLRRRARGIGVSEEYALSPAARFGLAYGVERETVSSAASSFGRGELTPSFVFDSTRGSGAAKRGERFSASSAWIGSAFFARQDALRPAIDFRRSVSDPWSGGRNLFALHLQGAALVPRDGRPLGLEERFYPGEELVRGFRRGSLGTWTSVPAQDPRASGADRMAALSMEYRVPIQGPASAAGFFDLGWTRLLPRQAEAAGTGARLIEETSGVLRASLGGELRLDLPVLRQPAR